MWKYGVSFFVLIYSTLSSNLVVGTNGSENRQHENTTNPSNYTVVTSFSKNVNVGNASNDAAVSNGPIAVSVFSTSDNANTMNKDHVNNESKNINKSSVNVNNSEGRSNITARGETVSKKDGNPSSVSSGKAVEKIPANRPSLWNNTALLNAFFPSLHVTPPINKYDGKLDQNDGDVTDKNNEARKINNTTTRWNDNNINNNNRNDSNNNKNDSYTFANVTNTYNNATQATNLSKNNGTLSNTTSNLLPKPINETIYRRNGTKVLTNNLFDDAIPIVQTQNETRKQKSDNTTESGGNKTAPGPSFTPRKPSFYVPDIPSRNPIKNEVSNNVVNHVVNPFGSDDSPASSEQSNDTQTTKQTSKENTTSFPDFPDASPITGSRPQNISASNTTAFAVSRDNTTTPALVQNSTHLMNQTFFDTPNHGTSGNVSVGNETKPVISSVFMGIIPIVPRRKTSSNIVNGTSQNVDNSTTSNDTLPHSGEHKSDSVVSENVSPIPVEMKNLNSITENTEQRNISSKVTSRNDITTTNATEKPDNNSVTQLMSNRQGISLFSADLSKSDLLNGEEEPGRNKTQTRSIKSNDVVELGPEDVVDGGLVTSRPVNHVTVMKASEKEGKKKKVTPESEMMDDNILHPTALMEYYELRDDGSETCEGRPEGTYAIRDVTKFVLCKGSKMKVIGCDGDMVYDVNVQKCTPRGNVNRDRFCRFRGDGTWDSPWNSRMNIQCAKGFISGESCKHDLRYDPVLKDCVEDTLIIRCFSVDRDYTNAKLGCYRKNNMKMEMLINDLPGSRGKHILDWNKFVDSVESLVCRCSKAAYEKGYPFFAIRLWAECWAGKNGTELDSLVSDPSLRDEKFCYSNISIAAFDKCEDNDTRVCVGSEHGQYVYKIVNVTEVNFTNSAPPKSKDAAQGGSSRSQINNQQSTTFIDLITLTDLQKIQASGKLRLIDVREEFEYDDVGSIRDSINIPLKDLSRALMMSNKDFKAKYGIPKPAKDDCGIVFLCSSGVRSDMAYKIAKDMGYKCPKSLKGGYDLLPKVPIM